MDYKTPGVYVEEVSLLPPSVAQVETAIPAFIGYTKKASDENGKEITAFPYTTRIKSFAEFEERFGGAKDVYSNTITVDANGVVDLKPSANDQKYKLYYALQLYFANGGGPCYICAAAKYGTTDVFSNADLMTAGLAQIGKEDEPTMLVFPDAQGFETAQKSSFYDLFKAALSQSALLGDRVTIVDVFNPNDTDTFSTVATDFRNGIGNNHLKYGAAYYPYLNTTYVYQYDESKLQVSINGGGAKTLKLLPIPPATEVAPADEANSVFHSDNDIYHKIKEALAKQFIVLAPGAALAGVYATVDRQRGVWKAPANVSLSRVKKILVNIDDIDQADMNVHSSGKSVNAIREFTGKGILVWGARTLAGNDNEWRYVSVRRFYNMVEESVKKASMQFVFEPNDANTWVKIKAMIENFLSLQWRAGALAGATPDEAFFVKVGLGETMTALDVLEGRLIIEIGMAVVRPAEFIILRFSHKMQES